MGSAVYSGTENRESPHMPLSAPPRFRMRWSTAGLLALAFATLYFAIGPGCFFSVDEVVVQEMAQGIYQRGTLEIPAMPTTRGGRGAGFYGHHGPGLGYAAVPFVAAGNFLDNHFGSMKGGVVAGPPLGTLEHPLRWGGRLAATAALTLNAIIGGLIVAMLFLIAAGMGASQGAALLMACAAGLSTLLVSESTHFFQHPLEALALLLGFWFLFASDHGSLLRRAWLGGLALGIALVARPNSAAAAAVIWAFWMVSTWREARDKKRDLIRPAIFSVVAVIVFGIIYLLYNYAQFGSLTDFGYTLERERFALDFWQALKATFAYLASPSLSIFLFAPPLLLAVPWLPHSLKRWAVETKALLSACLAELLLLVFYRSWHGDIAYGPRHMLAVIVLLMLLTLPAFERVLANRGYLWRITAALLVAVGVFIQLVGISVYVTTNEWYRTEHKILNDGVWVFVPQASPVVVQWRDLLAGRNLIPWGLRAVHSHGAALVFLLILLLVAAAAGVKLLIRHAFAPQDRSPASLAGASKPSYLPEVATVALGLLIFAGFAMTRFVEGGATQRAYEYLNQGLALQQSGKVVAAEEDYAVALGLDPSNKFAAYNLGVLYDQSGYVPQAVQLYERVLQQDAGFAAARHNLSRYRKLDTTSILNPSTATGTACNTPVECYKIGEAYWNAGNKQQALAAWQQAAIRFPQEVAFVRSAALCRYKLGDFDGAVRDYRKASSMAPQELGIRTDLAWALLGGKHFEEAYKIGTEVIARDPSNADAIAILKKIQSEQQAPRH